jgi:hypothetical protein
MSWKVLWYILLFLGKELLLAVADSSNLINYIKTFENVNSIPWLIFS